MWRKSITLLALFPMIVPGLCAQAADSIPSIEETIAHLPFEDADLEKLLANEIVFYVNRTSTDQVAGFGGGMKRSIGRGMMRSAVIQQFESIRRSVE